MTTAKIVNCKTAGIRRNPVITQFSEDLLGSLPSGDKINVDFSRQIFDWKDNAFYLCNTEFGDGYIRCELVEEIY